MIDKLTKEQEAKIPEYLDKFLKIGLSTEPCNRPAAEKAITESYLYQKMKAPEFIWAASPFEGARLAAAALKVNKNLSPADKVQALRDHMAGKNVIEVTEAEVRDQASKASYGSFEAYWVAFYAFISEQLPVKQDPLYQIVQDIVKNCGVYWTFEECVIVTEKPVAIHMKENKLHNPEGLALEYPDGTGIFAIDGKRHKSLMDMTLTEIYDESKTTKGKKGKKAV